MKKNTENKVFQDIATMIRAEKRRRAEMRKTIQELICKDFPYKPEFYIDIFDKLGYTLSKKVI